MPTSDIESWPFRQHPEPHAAFGEQHRKTDGWQHRRRALRRLNRPVPVPAQRRDAATHPNPHQTTARQAGIALLQAASINPSCPPGPCMFGATSWAVVTSSLDGGRAVARIPGCRGPFGPFRPAPIGFLSRTMRR